MRHNDNRLTLSVQITENLHNLETGLAVEIAGGFITEEDFWIVDESPCNSYTLLLTS